MGQTLRKTVWRSLKKLKIELAYDPSVLQLDICPKKMKTLKDICNPMVIAALFTITRCENNLSVHQWENR